MAGATVYENLTDVASYSYDPTKREFVSYDTPHIVTIKAQYAQSKGLAGAMFWEVRTLRRGCTRTSLVDISAHSSPPTRPATIPS